MDAPSGEGRSGWWSKYALHVIVFLCVLTIVVIVVVIDSRPSTLTWITEDFASSVSDAPPP